MLKIFQSRPMTTLWVLAIFLLAVCLFAHSLYKRTKLLNMARSRWAGIEQITITGMTTGNDTQAFVRVTHSTSDGLIIKKIREFSLDPLSPLKIRRWPTDQRIATRQSLDVYAVRGSESNRLFTVLADSLLFISDDSYADLGYDVHTRVCWKHYGRWIRCRMMLRPLNCS
jgi:hypothetical protein